MKDYWICSSVCLPLGLAVCPAIGEKSPRVVRARTLRTQQRAKINANRRILGCPCFQGVAKMCQIPLYFRDFVTPQKVADIGYKTETIRNEIAINASFVFLLDHNFLWRV